MTKKNTTINLLMDYQAKLADLGRQRLAVIAEWQTPKGAQNVAVAKEFLKYAIEPKVLNEYLKGGLGRWAIPYPEMIKTDPFWLHSGDQHRTAYITETLVGPAIPLYEAYSPAAAQVAIPGMSSRSPGATSSPTE